MTTEQVEPYYQAFNKCAFGPLQIKLKDLHICKLCASYVQCSKITNVSDHLCETFNASARVSAYFVTILSTAKKLSLVNQHAGK